MVAVADDLAESVFDGRVVRVDEVPVDILHCEGGFACARNCVVSTEEGGHLLGAGWRPDEREWEGRKAYRQIYCRRWPSCAVSAEEAWCWWTASLTA
jgi:hypothetical protein